MAALSRSTDAWAWKRVSRMGAPNPQSRQSGRKRCKIVGVIPSPPRSRAILPRRAPFSDGFFVLLWRVVVALGALHVVYLFGVMVPAIWSRTDRFRDVVVYFDAAMRLKNGVAVYQPWPDYGVQLTPFRFFYTPPFLLLTRPLAELGFVQFARAWLILMLAALWIYAACLSKLATGKWDWKAALVFGMVINVALRGWFTLALGQAEPIMWLLFGLALTTRSRAGWLALATLVKVHPIWALALALWNGKAAAWKSALAFALPVVALSFWLAGTRNWMMWWPSTQPVASQGTFNPDNWSLSFFGLRIAHRLGALADAGTLPPLARLYLSVFAVTGPLLMAFWTRKLSPELRLCLVACAAIVCAPLCWTVYFPLFLLPLAVWIGERRAVSKAV